MKASACTKFNINNFYNGSLSIDIIEKNLIIKTKKVKDMIAWHRCQFKMGTVVRILEANVKKQYIHYYKECLQYVRRNTWYCLFNSGVSLYKKCLLVGTCISPSLMARLDIWRRKKIVENSVSKG